MNKFTVKVNDHGRTILKYLEKMLSDVPKSRIEKAFREKDIKLNGERVKDKTVLLNEGDEVEVFGIQFTTDLKVAKAVEKKFDIIFEDKNVLIAIKRAGDEVHGEFGCLDDQVLSYLKFKQKDSFVPSSIGRLDKVTSGIIVYAKNYDTLRQLKDRQDKFKKIYVLRSDLPQSTVTKFHIDHDENLKREVCNKDGIGKPTETIFTVEKSGLILAELVTGRKHQIRASLSKLGYPIYGDVRYGGKKEKRVYLHSYYLKFKGLKDDLEYLNNQEFINNPNW